ncbi:histone-lysine N-methyltransferase CLF-like [Apium graveolens]|uniref:histone-lysine N-methyltransferase CLF-like n=1 Tax=Apium graveolens TaxID=4045 RepID=UPI003D7C04D1
MTPATGSQNKCAERRDTLSVDSKNRSRTERRYVSSATMALLPTAGKRIKLPKVERLPSFITWIPLARNRRMTEDQSVVGRIQIYYDQRDGEALIYRDSDSDKEVINEEEEKIEFTIFEDEILRKTTKEFGLADAVLNALAQCFYKKPCQIKARYDGLNSRDINCDATSSSFLKKDPNVPSRTFNTPFCRQCFILGCRLHRSAQNVIFPAEKQRPMRLAVEEQKSCESGTTSEKSLLKKALEICDQNSENVLAREADKGVDPLAENCAEGDVQKMGTQRGGKSSFVRKRGKVRCSKFTKKSSSYSSVRSRISVKKGELNHHYEPCGCKSACGKDCLCLLNRTHCEKYCGCPKSCKNRFRGCRCAKRQCRTRQCSCVAASRECDPDVCRNCFIGCGDGTCGAPPQKEKGYNCMNMRLLQNQHQKVLVAISDVSGWGAFIKNACEKDECIGEYRGELITHKEADKRGRIYDLMNSSYLFDLNDQYVLDALRMGSKLRFANHDSNPNCYAKILLVDGDHRIGIFAGKNLSPGQELFLDYCYGEDVAPQWVKDHKASGSNKDKEYTTSRSRVKRKTSSSKEDEGVYQAKRKVSSSKEDEEYTPSRSRAKRKVSRSKKDEEYNPSRKRAKLKDSGSKKGDDYALH